MTLAELSPSYEESAAAIGARLKQLRRARRESTDPEVQRRLRRRILELKPLYTQCRELAQLTAHYYDRSVCRNEKYTI